MSGHSECAAVYQKKLDGELRDRMLTICRAGMHVHYRLSAHGV
jgi:hypothetical protein